MTPTPGKPYTAINGDTLPSIATRAYGLRDKWTLIYDANQFALRSDDLESIQPGEVIHIPFDPELEALKIARSNL